MEIINQNSINLLKIGSVGVLPTDTLYGLVGLALNKETVERIYNLKQRNSEKPFIILIPSLDDLKFFNVEIDKKTSSYLEEAWPEKISVVLPCPNKKFEYLHRGTKTLAFRIPDKKELLNLLKEIGPLVAPSANPEGEKPAENIEEAKEYFEDKVDFYIDAGKITSLPSTLITFENGKVVVLREGAVKIN